MVTQAITMLDRIRQVRIERFGEDTDSMAELVRVPAETWLNYEAGVSMSGLILLRFLDGTGTHPHWLLTGEGPMFLDR